MLRDAPFVDLVEKALKPFRTYLLRLSDDLSAAYSAGPRSASVRATITHAVQFETWAALTKDGSSDDAAARLVLDWIEGARRS